MQDKQLSISNLNWWRILYNLWHKISLIVFYPMLIIWVITIGTLIKDGALDKDMVVLIMLWLMFVLLPLFISARFAKKKYELFFTRHVHKRIFSDLYPELFFSAKEHLPFFVVRESGLFDRFEDNKSVGAGLLSGMLGGINLQLSYMQIWNESRNNVSQLFEGIFAHAQFKSSHNQFLVIVPDLQERYIGKDLAHAAQALLGRLRDMELFKTGLEEFERYYTVFGSLSRPFPPSIADWLLAHKEEKISLGIAPQGIYLGWDSTFSDNKFSLSVGQRITEERINQLKQLIKNRIQSIQELAELVKTQL